ncbi:DNA polymerase zeta, partial [Nowakowskiella sp. JEL0407]
KNLVPSLAMIWEEEKSRRLTRDLPEYYTPMSQKETRYEYTPWHNEKALRQQIEFVLKNEKNVNAAEQFPGLVEDGVLTVYQAIEALHPRLRRRQQDNFGGLLTPFFNNQKRQNHELFETTLEADFSFTQDDFDFMTQRAPAVIDRSIIRDQSNTDLAEILEWMASENEDGTENEDGEDVNDYDFPEPFSQTEQGTQKKGLIICRSDETNETNETDVSDYNNLDISDDELEEIRLMQVDGASDDILPQTLRRSKRPRFIFKKSSDQISEEIVDEHSQTPTITPTLNSEEIPTITPTLNQKPSLNKLQKSVGFNITTDAPVKVDAEYPTFVVDHKDYFTNSIKEMWSPVEDGNPVQPSFFVDPPMPTSPSDPKFIPDNSHVRQVTSESNTSSLSNSNESVVTSEVSNAPEFTITNTFTFIHKPPTKKELLTSLDKYNIPEMVYKKPYFSDPRDATAQPRIFAGREIKIPIENENLPMFCESSTVNADKLPPSGSIYKTWIPSMNPPSRKSVKKWLSLNPSKENRILKRGEITQIDGPTPNNTFGFKSTQIAEAETMSRNKDNYLLTFSLEIHARSRLKKTPDPKNDPVCSIFYCLQNNDEKRFKSNGKKFGFHVGLISVGEETNISKSGICGYQQTIVESEYQMIENIISTVREWDPDILVGYEIHGSSWGYLIERAKIYEINLCKELSRVAEKTKTKFGKEEDAWGVKKASGITTTGRLFLNVWRLMRHEIAITSYTLENMVFHVLHQRIAKFSNESLTAWYDKGGLHRWKTLKYYLERVQLNIELLEGLGLVKRTSEFARVYGIDFNSVLSRGSQFKVEAVLARITRPENFLMVSPSRKQVAEQRAPECIPLVMEPLSRFYNDPVLVLDFQSLYPSVMIAYNYCFSTCLGRINQYPKEQQLGVIKDYNVDMEELEKLKDQINVSPNGLAFVKSDVREGVLGRMLVELLDTRVMVKQSMKLHKSDKDLTKILDSRQLGLKLLANVTYGYAGATFSGRMPCVEIADAIVQTARATLERCITLIDSNPTWNARVVYGDTDSLFVSLPGRSKESAFQIGNAIVQEMTKINPYPVKLKFEKVYHPCMLLTKKRYVGFMYETIDQKEPIFDAKGIETVRRDGCPVVAKMLESSLKSQNLSELKIYVYDQWEKILTGRVSVKDFIIATEVKLGSYSGKKGTMPPGALLASKRMVEDPGSEPQYAERVPYVIVYGGPKDRKVDQAVLMDTFLSDRSLRINGEYYIRKQIIPPLNRIFNIVGIDLSVWFDEMPKRLKSLVFQTPFDLLDTEDSDHNQKGRIDQYYASIHCLTCRKITSNDICPTCLADPLNSSAMISYQIREIETKFNEINRICKSCTGHSSLCAFEEFECVSIDCPVYFARWKARSDLMGVQRGHNVLTGSFDF